MGKWQRKMCCLPRCMHMPAANWNREKVNEWVLNILSVCQLTECLRIMLLLFSPPPPPPSSPPNIWMDQWNNKETHYEINYPVAFDIFSILYAYSKFRLYCWFPWEKNVLRSFYQRQYLCQLNKWREKPTCNYFGISIDISHRQKKNNVYKLLIERDRSHSVCCCAVSQFIDLSCFLSATIYGVGNLITRIKSTMCIIGISVSEKERFFWLIEWESQIHTNPIFKQIAIGKNKNKNTIIMHIYAHSTGDAILVPFYLAVFIFGSSKRHHHNASERVTIGHVNLLNRFYDSIWWNDKANSRIIPQIPIPYSLQINSIHFIYEIIIVCNHFFCFVCLFLYIVVVEFHKQTKFKKKTLFKSKLGKCWRFNV